MTPKKLLTVQFVALFTLLSIPALQASAQNTFVQPRITQAVDESQLTVLQHNTYPLARAEFDRGPAPATLPMENMLLVLKRSPQQEAALAKLMAEQLDKSSPNFHKWLTPAQFGQQFGPADQDIQTITSWLGSHGFQVVNVSNGRTVINFSGNAAQVQQAFHTAIHSYVVNGEQHWANSSDPQIPTALTPVVAGVHTLHNFRWKPANVHAGEFIKSKETGKVARVHSEFTYTTTNGFCETSCFGVGPTDFATIYNVLPRWTASNDGTGVTIAVVGQTDINAQDNVSFRSMFGLPASHLMITQNPDAGAPPIIGPGGNDDEAEADIDTQWSGAIAKGATINFVKSASTNTSNGVDLSSTYIVDNNLAPILTESYGACELDLGSAGNLFYYDMWQQAAAEGMSVFIASGDEGSAACDTGTANAAATSAVSGLQVSGFASTPFNVAVGGTDFNDINSSGTVLSQYWSPTNTPSTQSSALSYIPEVVWNNACSSSLWGVIGFSTDPLANCNNSEITSQVQGVIGGGGGVSACTFGNPVNAAACIGGYSKPSWQAGPGVPNDGKRDIPDLSFFSASGFFNGSFYIVCQMDANTGSGSSTSSCDLTSPFNDFQGFGGTSVATPAMAGVMALVVQQTGENQGNPNPVQYTLAAQANIYHAITGTNAMPCTPATPDCTDASGSDTFGLTTVQTGPLTGSLGYNASSDYNLATGLGSLNVANFVTGFASAIIAPDFSVSLPATPPTPTTVTLTAGGSQNTTVTLTGTTGYTGTVTLSCSGLPTGTTCAFTPTTPVAVTGTAAVQVPLMLMNTANGMLSPMGHRTNPTADQPGSGRWMLLFVGFAIMWLGIQARRRKLRWSVVASLLLVGSLLGIAACGGGSGGGTTPPPPPAVTNQTVVITATDGTRTHSTYLLLTVQ
ncbi:MAG: S53 family peptidase [Candidatus Acidiferrales bacterium]|jgi:subtilase family serine protease